MPRYHITLPNRIPRNLFDNLNGVRNTEGKLIMPIVRSLDNAYNRVDKDTYNYASSSINALAQNFNRSLEDDQLSARSLTKMFRPVADRYAVLDEAVQEVQEDPEVQLNQAQVRQEPRAEQLELNLQ